MKSLIWSREGRLPRLQAGRGVCRRLGLGPPAPTSMGSQSDVQAAQLFTWMFTGNGQHVSNESLGPSAEFGLSLREGLARNPFPEQRPTPSLAS